MMSRDELTYIIKHPVALARVLGFTKLSPNLHDEWIRIFAFSEDDYTLQAHRNSYKTSCVIIALALRIIVLPNESMMLLRKDQGSTAEVIRSVKRCLESDVCNDMAMMVHGKHIEFERSNSVELHTNLVTDTGVKESQLQGDGVRSFGLTGKHFARIFTDDIITLKDRMSRAERGMTDAVYQELQNLKSPNGTIINTGTPWHKNDTFRLMPPAVRYTVYDTGILEKAEIDNRRRNMTASLFSANHELKHISDEESMFGEPKYGKYPNIGGFAQIDCAYGGPDTTALTVMCRDKEGVIHGFGQLYKGHVQDHYGEIVGVLEKYNAGTLYNETNGDKGYFAKEFRQYWPVISPYHESMNKHVKIVTFLKREWDNILWDDDTDPEYMEQIVDYQEGQDRDDAPDSASSLIREFNRGKIKAVGALSYK